VDLRVQVGEENQYKILADLALRFDAAVYQRALNERVRWR
jgi:hypothetical protein